MTDDTNARWSYAARHSIATRTTSVSSSVSSSAISSSVIVIIAGFFLLATQRSDPVDGNHHDDKLGEVVGAGQNQPHIHFCIRIVGRHLESGEHVRTHGVP